MNYCERAHSLYKIKTICFDTLHYVRRVIIHLYDELNFMKMEIIHPILTHTNIQYGIGDRIQFYQCLC